MSVHGKVNITDAERLKRQKNFEFTRGSIELEGYVLTEDDEANAQRYINGEITMEEFVSLQLEEISNNLK